jgi:predicted dehydrogenase
MSTSKLRWGILGNATIGRVCVVPAIAKSRNGTVHAVASRSLDRARALTDLHGGTPVEGYDALLADPEIDAVYIPLPNHLHRDWTLRALAAGKHVLVEKPFALNAKEAREMVAAARSADRVLMEAFMYRFHPRSIEIKRRVAAGELGKIGSLRAAFSYPTTRDGGNERLFSAEMGGGSLWDVGCYGVSVARWLLDAEPIAVTANALVIDGVDHNFSGALRFANGAIATVESGFCSALQQTYAVFGDKAAIELPHDAFIPWEKQATFQVRDFSAEVGETVVIDGADEYQLMVEGFAESVWRGGGFSADDSIRQMATLDALKRAYETGKTIFLPTQT